MSCGGTSCVRSGLVPSYMGFANPAIRCGGCPCPSLPLFKVVICFWVNSVSQLVIQEGCAAVPVDNCYVSFLPGITETSWGRLCRKVTWTRSVQGNRFVRLRVCSADGCSSCPETPTDVNGLLIPNRLINFTINGDSYLSFLNELASSDTDAGCTFVHCTDCTDPEESRCYSENARLDVETFIGTVIQVGPMNALPWSL
jgi:hypothetical protein